LYDGISCTIFQGLSGDLEFALERYGMPEIQLAVACLLLYEAYEFWT
jgi:hypothetical protein